MDRPYMMISFSFNQDSNKMYLFYLIWNHYKAQLFTFLTETYLFWLEKLTFHFGVDRKQQQKEIAKITKGS